MLCRRVPNRFETTAAYVKRFGAQIFLHDRRLLISQIDDNHVIRYIPPDEFAKTVVAERSRRLANSDRRKCV